MTRSLKFRAWDRDSAHMYDVISFAHPTAAGFDSVGITSEGMETWLEGAEFVLMQFTGLKDKHGAAIYESDILRYVVPPEHDDGSASDERYIVEWLTYGFGARWLNPPNVRSRSDPTLALHGADEDLEVIGNIYEHPHLLEQPS